MNLYATPLSHFSRKVRILLDLYKLSYKFIDIGNVAESDSSQFGKNPLLKVPTFVDGGNWIIESDHISQYLIRTYDPDDRYQVLTNDLAALNMRAVLNGIMQEEVKYILAKRTKVPVEQYKFFDKALKAMADGLDWANENAQVFSLEAPGYLEFHLLCLWDHLEYYGLLDLNYSKLNELVLRLRKDERLNATSPFVLKPK